MCADCFKCQARTCCCTTPPCQPRVLLPPVCAAVVAALPAALLLPAAQTSPTMQPLVETTAHTQGRRGKVGQGVSGRQVWPLSRAPRPRPPPPRTCVYASGRAATSACSSCNVAHRASHTSASSNITLPSKLSSLHGRRRGREAAQPIGGSLRLRTKPCQRPAPPLPCSHASTSPHHCLAYTCQPAAP